MDNSISNKRTKSNEIDMLNSPLFKKILRQQFVTGTFQFG